jgi:hypothetical protein
MAGHLRNSNYRLFQVPVYSAMTAAHHLYEKMTFSRMWLTSVLTATGSLLLLAVALPQIASAQAASLSGRWTLDREHSDFPREVGFGVPIAPVTNGSDAPPQGGGGRGGRRGGGGRGVGPIPSPFNPRVESADDARRRDILTGEVRTPSPTLTVADNGDSVVITDDQNHTRTFHPDGRAEAIQLDGVSVVTTAHRDSGKLIVLYAVEDLRQLRYMYSRSASPEQLVVEIEFLERNAVGDALHRVYASGANGAVTATAAAGSGATGSDAQNRPPLTPPPATPFGRGAQQPPAFPAAPRSGGAPAGGAGPSPARPVSEFAGLKRIGVVVEDLTSMAAGCGLTHDGIESAVAKRFSDAGLTVRNNSDEDTYVYVSVMTSTLPTGMCISRYDWFIYSNTEATLTHQQQPVLAQVMLAHKGGLTGSGPSTHAADVMRALDDGLAQIASRIQQDNR